jgi:hypothetical protein
MINPKIYLAMSTEVRIVCYRASYHLWAQFAVESASLIFYVKFLEGNFTHSKLDIFKWHLFNFFLI